ncbi:hypothetical protein CYMTET_35558 [Cymbomonas tetramitiformis]|uniref:Methyltransferase domain-containing protein n=1 Tax=Cymbomonas tetramitiformis TaxID=36881 RepID=A0AAE0F8Y1_9CHLO|nr:hypothetical protein CYMTET_35558 [Cymbomonas tetramitiformis]
MTFHGADPGEVPSAKTLETEQLDEEHQSVGIQDVAPKPGGAHCLRLPPKQLYTFVPDMRSRVFSFRLGDVCTSGSSDGRIGGQPPGADVASPLAAMGNNGGVAELQLRVEQTYLNIDGTGGAVYPVCEFLCHILALNRPLLEDLFEGRSVLDLGCGPGLLAMFWQRIAPLLTSNSRYCAVDGAPEVAELCRRNLSRGARDMAEGLRSGSSGVDAERAEGIDPSKADSRVQTASLWFGRKEVQEFLGKPSPNLEAEGGVFPKAAPAEPCGPPFGPLPSDTAGGRFYDRVVLCDCCYDDAFLEALIDTVVEIRNHYVRHRTGGTKQTEAGETKGESHAMEAPGAADTRESLKVIVCFQERHEDFEDWFLENMQATGFESTIDVWHEVKMSYDENQGEGAEEGADGPSFSIDDSGAENDSIRVTKAFRMVVFEYLK